MPLEIWRNIRGDAVGELELEAQEKAVGGIVIYGRPPDCKWFW